MPLYFATETVKCSQIHAVCNPLKWEISAHTLNHIQLITPYAMHVNVGYVNGYIWKAVVYVNIT